MHIVGGVHVENFENVAVKTFQPKEVFNDPSSGVILTLVSRPNTAGTLPSGFVRSNNDTVLVLGDQSEMRFQFKDQNGKPARVEKMSFYWATHPDYTKEDERLDAEDEAAKNILFAEPVRMEIRREGKAYAWNHFAPPTNQLTIVELKNIILDELLFTTSRRGKVSFDHFNWSIT